MGGGKGRGGGGKRKGGAGAGLYCIRATPVWNGEGRRRKKEGGKKARRGGRKGRKAKGLKGLMREEEGKEVEVGEKFGGGEVEKSGKWKGKK